MDSDRASRTSLSLKARPYCINNINPVYHDHFSTQISLVLGFTQFEWQVEKAKETI